ncbi:MAG: DUF6516 family protein, partial [bacterium]
NVIELIDEETVKLIKIKAELLDETLLYITELYTLDYQKYSYNWQKKNGELIIRWDNKPHWKNIKTYPYHKHKNGEVLSSYRVTVDDVIEVIREKIREVKESSEKL